MRCPGNDGRCKQRAQAGDNSDPDCENEDVVHERFFFKTRTITSLVPRDGWGLLDLRRIVRSPVIFDPFQPLDPARPPINPVTVEYRARFGIAAAFGVVIFAEDKLKISI